MVVSLFGPDGVGKSTLARGIEKRGLVVFSGTGVANWPDQSWHTLLLAQGLHEPNIDTQTHFIEKIRRCHALAAKLEAKHGTVVIDSDPLTKTLMHVYIRALKRGDDPAFSVQQHFLELEALLPQSSGYKPQFIHFQISTTHNTKNIREQADECLRRINERPDIAYFDPRTTAELERMIEANIAICKLLKARDYKVKEVSTLMPVNCSLFVRYLLQ